MVMKYTLLYNAAMTTNLHIDSYTLRPYILGSHSFSIMSVIDLFPILKNRHNTTNCNNGSFYTLEFYDEYNIAIVK